MDLKLKFVQVWCFRIIEILYQEEQRFRYIHFLVPGLRKMAISRPLGVMENRDLIYLDGREREAKQ